MEFVREAAAELFQNLFPHSHPLDLLISRVLPCPVPHFPEVPNLRRRHREVLYICDSGSHASGDAAPPTGTLSTGKAQEKLPQELCPPFVGRSAGTSQRTQGFCEDPCVPRQGCMWAGTEGVLRDLPKVKM